MINNIKIRHSRRGARGASITPGDGCILPVKEIVQGAHWTFASRLLRSSGVHWRISIRAETTASEKTSAAVSKSVPRGANDAETERY
jgi:hypothetical protein